MNAQSEGAVAKRAYRRRPTTSVIERELRREVARLNERIAELQRPAAWGARMNEYLTETRQLKEFLVWEARKDGMSPDVLAFYEKALDKIKYDAALASTSNEQER